jgi:hypothetical protein
MPCFVILEHDHPQRHWDLLLETGDHLRSWRLAEEPDRGRSMHAEAIADHRLLYLDYEGPVGGNRGRVVRWDGGHYTGGADGNSRLSVVLEGERFQGVVTFEQVSGMAWRISFLDRA